MILNQIKIIKTKQFLFLKKQRTLRKTWLVLKSTSFFITKKCKKGQHIMGKNNKPYTIEYIKEHPWFKEIDWEMLLAQKVTPPFIPVCTEDYFDENYLQSFELSTKLREDINMQNKNVRNPNIQKLFKGFYFDKDKCRESNTTTKSAPTSASKSTKSS